MRDLDEAYERKRSALARAEERLRALLLQVVDRIEDRMLVRAEFDDVRMKDLSSLTRKAKRFGWSAEEALIECGDLVGGRVVCNNVEDVYRFEELLKECLPQESGLVERHDYIEEPNKQGYRALHLNFCLNVSESFDYEFIPCEVQIRSRLQDAWAKLSHPDIYKQENLPRDLRDRAKDLSKLLETADSIASDIRSRVARITVPPKRRPDFERVTDGGFAYIFKDVFGRAPPEYVLTQAKNLCAELGVSSLRSLPDTLKRQQFRDELGEAYRAILGLGIDNETIFIAALHAVAGGDSRALRYVRRRAKEEFREIDRIARREMLSDLPGSVEDMLEALESERGEAAIESWAKALDATRDCAICSATIVDAYAFAEAAVRHYRVPRRKADDAFQRIEQAIYRSGVDTGGWSDSSLCTYHENRADKD
jgi:putative GTP pyrophosphokinase